VNCFGVGADNTLDIIELSNITDKHPSNEVPTEVCEGLPILLPRTIFLFESTLGKSTVLAVELLLADPTLCREAVQISGQVASEVIVNPIKLDLVSSVHQSINAKKCIILGNNIVNH
jgi:hypothetical protein